MNWRLRQGVDDRLLVIVLTLLVAGCINANGPKSHPIKPGTTTIEQLAFDASQQRDALAADGLDRLADDLEAGTEKYDAKVMERLATINEESSQKAGAALSAAVAKELNPGTSLDTKRAAKVIHDLATGRRRASK